jgi:hypothetical protein
VLRELLNPQHGIGVVTVTEGSTIVTLDMDFEGVEALVKAFAAGTLDSLHIDALGLRLSGWIDFWLMEPIPESGKGWPETPTTWIEKGSDSLREVLEIAKNAPAVRERYLNSLYLPSDASADSDDAKE